MQGFRNGCPATSGPKPLELEYSDSFALLSTQISQGDIQKTYDLGRPFLALEGDTFICFADLIWANERQVSSELASENFKIAVSTFTLSGDEVQLQSNQWSIKKTADDQKLACLGLENTGELIKGQAFYKIKLQND